MKPFELHEPTTVREAVSLLARYGDEAKVYAGGTELLLAMKERLLRYDHLVNVKTVSGLDGIAYDDATGVLSVGPTTTHRALEMSPVVRERFPLLADAEGKIGNVRVRNVGTIGGNLCFAEPHSDPGVVLLLFDARVEVAGPGGERGFTLDELAVGPYETSLDGDELLTEIQVPALPPGMRAAYLRFGYHERPTIGLGVAARLDPRSEAAGGDVLEEIRIAVGSVGPNPVRVREAEDFLKGRPVAEIFGHGGALDGSPSLAEAARLAAQAADPVTDLHGSAEYKTHLILVFLRRALAAAVGSGTAQAE